MTYFTGKQLLRTYGSDPDLASYQQTYASPSFGGYFIGYKDLLNTNYGFDYAIGGGKLGSQGDYFNFDTVYNSDTTPANMATILTFFDPRLGVFSTSVLPGMEFYSATDSTSVAITRPRNKGISLAIQRDSSAGLAFYGQSLDQNVDKPTRLLVDFSYSASENSNRHRVLEIDDSDYAGWVDGLHPNDTMNTGSAFYLAGNLFKYSADGYDQAPTAFGPAVDGDGNLVSNGLLQGQQYSLTSTPPVFEVASPSTYSSPGEVQRYRRPPVYQFDSAGREVAISNYYNITPEKMAFFKFNLDSLPIDTLLNSATLEVHFCSGFTIRQGNDKDFTLSYNNLWKKSRLSGNGTTFDQIVPNLDGTPLLDASANPVTITRPLNNVHWRKNFFEIVIPYAFESNYDYDFRNIFSASPINALNRNTVPPSTLEYLGFINLDEIGVAPLDVEPGVYIETTQGLSNILLSRETVVWQISGTLHSDDSGNPDVSVWVDTSSNGLPDYATWQTNGLSTSYRYYTTISQDDVLPNMKVIVFPFGIGDVTHPELSEYIYGYVKSVLPSSEIGFDPKQIASYKTLLQYIVPLYAEYDVKLLESDTYFPFTTFGRGSSIEGTSQDISV